MLFLMNTTLILAGRTLLFPRYYVGIALFFIGLGEIIGEQLGGCSIVIATIQV